LSDKFTFSNFFVNYVQNTQMLFCAKRQALYTPLGLTIDQ